MNSLVSASIYLLNDSAAQAYIRQRSLSDLAALQADFSSATRTKNGPETRINLGYVTVTQTATGWLVNNAVAIGFVAVQAYILAKYW
jgi:hypothetical protein